MIFSFLPDRDPAPASLLLNGGISSIRLNILTFLQLPIISVNILTGAGQGAHLDPLPRAFSRALALHCIAFGFAPAGRHNLIYNKTTFILTTPTC